MTLQAGLATAALLLCGCNLDRPIGGPAQHENKVIDLDKSEMARVDIGMGAGELRVHGGSSKLLEADFTYSNPASKPVVDYHSGALRSEIRIQQRDVGPGVGDSDYKWDLGLNDNVALDLTTHLGAGQAVMDLGQLNLRSVEVNLGAGEVRMDLRGNPKRDYDVQIHGGVGQATVYLPKSVGISATAAGGIGEINVSGLEKRGDRWINPGHEHAPATIHLDVKGGIGEIRLVAE